MNKLLKFKLFALVMISAMASPMMARNIIIIRNGITYELNVQCTDDRQTRLNWSDISTTDQCRLNALNGALGDRNIPQYILKAIAERKIKPSSVVENVSETYCFTDSPAPVAPSSAPAPSSSSSSSSSSEPAPGSIESGAPLLPEVVVDSSKEESKEKSKDFVESIFRQKIETSNLGYPRLKFVPVATGVASILAMVGFAGRGVYDFAKDLFSKEDLEKAAEDESIIDQTTPNKSLLSSRLMGFAGALACGLASLYFYKKLSATGKIVENLDRKVEVDLGDQFKEIGEEPGAEPEEKE